MPQVPSEKSPMDMVSVLLPENSNYPADKGNSLPLSWPREDQVQSDHHLYILSNDTKNRSYIDYVT